MPSGPKKRRAARNKLNKLSSSPPSLNVSSNNNADDNETMIPKVTCCVGHETKDVDEFAKEDEHELMVECDNVVGGGVNGSQTAGAQKGDDQGGVSSEVAAVAAAEAEEEVNAASDVKVTIGMNQMISKVAAESSLETPQEGDDDTAPKVESAVVVEDSVSEVVAAEDKDTFGCSKTEERGVLSVVKEMLRAGFVDECAFEGYFGKVLGLVDDEFEGGDDAAATSTMRQQFKALLLLHKDLIKKGALGF